MSTCGQNYIIILYIMCDIQACTADHEPLDAHRHERLHVHVVEVAACMRRSPFYSLAYNVRIVKTRHSILAKQISVFAACIIDFTVSSKR